MHPQAPSSDKSRVSRVLAAALACLALLAAVPAVAQMPSPPPARPPVVEPATLSERARDTLDRVRPAIVQIQGFFGANTAQAFHGTGFAVGAGGLLLTNYHVVAEHVLYPEKYRLEYRSPDGATGKVTVLGIDVRHDLAVVRADGFAPEPLGLNTTVPPKGERAYSIGFPLDVGLTITEGVSNGRVADAFDARIHYSGAINPGMSGGPALDQRGDVIGINVSGYRFEQLVSFLVPAEHALALIERARRDPLKIDRAHAEVSAQLRAHARDLLAATGVLPPTAKPNGKDGSVPTQSVEGYRLPGKLAPFVDCNASGDPLPQQQIRSESIQCGAKAGVYVQQGLTSGDFTFSHEVMTARGLDAWRFARRLGALADAAGNFGHRRHLGPFSCRDQVVKLKGFDAALLVCVRSYRKLEGLFDFTARVVSLHQPNAGFASHVDLYGVEFEGGMAFMRRFVEAIQWRP